MTICVIDDNAVNLALVIGLARQIQDEEVLSFDHPARALAALAETSSDLILVDYMMPDIDGIEVIKRLRAMPLHADTPIAMVTTLDQRAVRIAALEAGATDFISKPIDALEFKVRAKNLMKLGVATRILRDRAEWLASEVAAATRSLTQREQEIIVTLARAAEYRDPETGAHIRRMARYCGLIAEQMGCNRRFIDDLVRAAPMHDVGKIAVADAVLLKPGALTADERREMQRHTQFGGEILAGSNAPIIKLAHEIATTHHERFDGKGYPLGLRGRAIPLSGRIAAVADVFDALTSERPYKRAWSIEEARAFLEHERGGHFDPDCVNALIARWDDIIAIAKDANAAQLAA
jgi:response regulator RpfG family c-di-GMP phosphodiesterase